MDLKQIIFDYLGTQRLMSVATFANDVPWIANVYFVHDNDLNLYFLSKKAREHCVALETNNKVAVAIADSHQPLRPPQLGIQLHGTAQRVNVLNQVKWMFAMWNKLIAPNADEFLEDPKQFLQAGSSSIYKITPKRIKFFNTGLWPEEQCQVLEL
ncbi:MAG: pyridoxamine 5'-phosphate oxidase family protein [Candidatus Dojkabacteria bacterium]|nr:MAG: pyridoxamine 5'-phosphate oxidase family protein [Candidatus Dojkabacteria bacterium]